VHVLDCSKKIQFLFFFVFQATISTFLLLFFQVISKSTFATFILTNPGHLTTFSLSIAHLKNKEEMNPAWSKFYSDQCDRVTDNHEKRISILDDLM